MSPASYITPYTPLTTDEAEASTEIQPGEPIKIQLGAQIDGFGSIVCDTVLATPEDKAGQEVSGRPADLMLATYYCNELLLRLMVPPGLLTQGTEEEKAKAASQKAPTQAKISSMLEAICKSYDCNIVESTTSWLFGHNEIEGAKKIVLSPAEGTKGDGTPEVSEVWGVEVVRLSFLFRLCQTWCRALLTQLFRAGCQPGNRQGQESRSARDSSPSYTADLRPEATYIP